MSEAKKHEPQTIIVKSPELNIQSSVTSKSVGIDELREQLKRRRVPRRPIYCAIGVLYKGRYQVSFCHEIGEGGVLMSSDVKIEENDSVVVTLLIPGVMNGVVIGKVVYAMASEKQEHARYGVMFEDVDFEVKRKIRNFVASGTSYVFGG